jgi:hypothetical protein
MLPKREGQSREPSPRGVGCVAVGILRRFCPLNPFLIPSSAARDASIHALVSSPPSGPFDSDREPPARGVPPPRPVQSSGGGAVPVRFRAQHHHLSRIAERAPAAHEDDEEASRLVVRGRTTLRRTSPKPRRRGGDVPAQALDNPQPQPPKDRHGDGDPLLRRRHSSGGGGSDLPVLFHRFAHGRRRRGLPEGQAGGPLPGRGQVRACAQGSPIRWVWIFVCVLACFDLTCIVVVPCLSLRFAPARARIHRPHPVRPRPAGTAGTLSWWPRSGAHRAPSP